MFVLVFVDNLNCSFSDSHISDTMELISASDNVDKLKEIAEEGGDIVWSKDQGKWVGEVWYDDEMEEEQQYVIYPTSM